MIRLHAYPLPPGPLSRTATYWKTEKERQLADAYHVQVEELHPYQAQIAKHYSQLECHFMQLKSFLHHLYIA
jgi:hypothetical protein